MTRPATQPADRVPCKACGAWASFLCQVQNEHSQTHILDIYRCANCGLVFVGNDITDTELAEAYASQDTARYYQETVFELIRKMKKSTQELQHLVGQQSRVIDIGTGDGTFIKLLMEQGFQQVAAHEIPGTDLSKLAASGCMVYQDFDYASVPDHAFDAVTLLDVAEHVRDIHQLFRVCARILRDDGIIYLHTPCVSRLDRMMHMVHQKVPPLALVARVWQRSRTSIFHLQIYSPQSLCLLLQEAGFTNISITVENELSWPVQRYVRVYICDKLGLPQGLAPVLVPLLYPFIATRFFNANKAIVHATKNVPAPGSVGTR